MNHYKIHKPEPIDLILKYDLNFVEGNVVKYILRSPFKGDSQGDLKKALHYAKLLKPNPHFSRIFDDSLSEYTELSPWLLKAIKATIELDIYLNSGENYIVYLIEQHLKSNKENNFKRHPLSILMDFVEMNPIDFLENVDCVEHEEDDISLYLFLKDMIEGDEDFLALLEKIGPGDKEFWKNRYDLFWKQTKKRYMSKI